MPRRRPWMVRRRCLLQQAVSQVVPLRFLGDRATRDRELSPVALSAAPSSLAVGSEGGLPPTRCTLPRQIWSSDLLLGCVELRTELVDWTVSLAMTATTPAGAIPPPPPSPSEASSRFMHSPSHSFPRRNPLSS
uniref:Predicted protein n=1 Tax=Hordeum vulgare subsp. vulgare TaxID=112509 RepID=F2EIA0_HORVV|nr:predicted protein [Hordeum vulgare subsp. vulgare]